MPDASPGRAPARFTAFLLPLDWARDAACKDVAEEDADRILFPERGGKANDARRLCKNCPVASECLEYALRDEDAFVAGEWGGTNSEERRKLQRVSEERRRCSGCSSAACQRQASNSH
jgi:hypothetical protein